MQGHGGELAQGHLGGGDSGAGLRGGVDQGGDLQQVAVAGREAAEGPGHGVQVIRRGGACGRGVDGGPCHVGIGDKGGLVEVQQGGQLTVAQKLEGRPEGLLAAAALLHRLRGGTGGRGHGLAAADHGCGLAGTGVTGIAGVAGTAALGTAGILLGGELLRRDRPVPGLGGPKILVHVIRSFQRWGFLMGNRQGAPHSMPMGAGRSPEAEKEINSVLHNISK